MVSTQFSSVTKLCPTLCDPMDCSMPGFRVLHYLPEFPQTQSLSQWYHPTISSSATSFSSSLQSFSASGSFLMSLLFASGGQSFGASGSASVLTMNIQGWFSLGLSSWISLQYKVLRCWNHTKSVILSLWYYGRNQCQEIFENNPHIFKCNVTFTKRDLWHSHWKAQWS